MAISANQVSSELVSSTWYPEQYEPCGESMTVQLFGKPVRLEAEATSRKTGNMSISTCAHLLRSQQYLIDLSLHTSAGRITLRDRRQSSASAQVSA